MTGTKLRRVKLKSFEAATAAAVQAEADSWIRREVKEEVLVGMELRAGGAGWVLMVYYQEG